MKKFKTNCIKMIILSTLLTLTTFSIQSPIYGEQLEEFKNIFINGDFESDINGEWYRSWGTGTFKIIENEGINNSRAISYSGKGDVTQKLKGLKPNTTYTLTAVGKLGTSKKGIIAVKYFDSNLKDGGFKGQDITSTQFQDISIEFTTGKSNTEATVFLGTKGDPGTVFADNFEILVNTAELLNDPMKIYKDELTDNGIYPLSDPQNTNEWEYSLTFSDEFENNFLDSEKWYDYHPYWEGRQPSMFSKDNVRVEDGKLKLTTKYVNEPTKEMIKWNQEHPDAEPYENFTTACVFSKEPSNYGYYEVKVKAAPASITSSFWFSSVRALGPGAEIDVFEMVGKSKLLPHFDHLYPINLHDFHQTPNQSYPFTWVTPDDVTEDFHTYGLEWNEYWLRFYYDGQLVHEQENLVWKEPEFIIMDMETFKWHGYPEPEDLPVDYEIEYLRVWRTKKEASKEPLYKLPDPKITNSIKGTPVIDGKIDDLWNKANDLDTLRRKGGTSFNSDENSANVKTMWDENFLYVLANIKDKDIFEKERTNNYKNDSFEVYIDGGNEKSTPYDNNDLKVNVDVAGRISGTNVPEGVKQGVQVLKDGYIVEMAIPWVDVIPKTGDTIGFDIQINNATTETETRVSYIGWNDPLDLVWKDMGMAGVLKFVNK